MSSCLFSERILGWISSVIILSRWSTWCFQWLLISILMTAPRNNRLHAIIFNRPKLLQWSVLVEAFIVYKWEPGSRRGSSQILRVYKYTQVPSIQNMLSSEKTQIVTHWTPVALPPQMSRVCHRLKGVDAALKFRDDIVKSAKSTLILF